MQSFLKKHAIVGSVALIVAGGGAIVVASGQAQDEAPKTPSPDAGVALIAPGSPNDRLPTSVEVALRDAAADAGASVFLRSAASVDERTAVRVVDSSIGRVSVVATDEGVCLASEKAGVSCGPGPARTNLIGGATVGDDGDSAVLFLVHDKIRTVRVSLRDGGAVDVPVRDNVAAKVVAGDPAGFQFVGADGRVVTTVGRVGDPHSR